MMKYTVVILIVVVAAALSCNKAVEPLVVTTYPFAAGNTWNYKVTYSISNFRATVPDSTLADGNYAWTATVTSLGDSLLRDSVHTLRLSAIENPFPSDGGQINHSDKFYLLRNDSLYLYAYSGIYSSVFPKRKPGSMFILNGKKYSDILDLRNRLAGDLYSVPIANTDTLQYPSSLSPVYVFPFEKEKEWIVNSQFILVKKKITGTELITTQAGNFSTFVVQWTYEGISGIDIKEYVNNQGLIKRSISFKDVTIASAENPEGYGIVDIKNEYEITSLDVH